MANRPAPALVLRPSVGYDGSVGEQLSHYFVSGRVRWPQSRRAPSYTQRMPGLQHTVTSVTPPKRVWAVVVDVARWSERIPTVDAVERLDAGPLAVGSRTRLQQPRLPTAVWTVTELADGSSYTWESSSPGVTVTAAHVVEPHPDGSRLTLALTVSGPLSGIGWLLTRSLTKRYVETEAASIKRAAETSTT
jgi:Polyketide cyclase / dehydrase and lipid transport